jgi:hypothetical protein
MDAEMPIQQEPINDSSFNTPLTPQQFYQGDPWLVFVKDKLHLDNIWNTAILFVISITYNLINSTYSQELSYFSPSRQTPPSLRHRDRRGSSNSLRPPPNSG